MNKAIKIITPLLLLSASQISAAEISKKNYQLSSLPQKIELDGIMNESVWQNATKMTLAFENNPGEGVSAPVKTEVFFFENGEALNVAIIAYDPEPEKIRASLRDRDDLGADDNVGIIIDTFNDERSAYQFFVNPKGAQADMRMSDTDGWDEDDSWDAIWDSSAQITGFGYVVEMSIPFNALRFPEKEGPLTWNVAGLRNYPRDVLIKTATYREDRNIICNLCQFDQLTGFDTVEAGNNFQLTPTLTVSRQDEKPQQGLVFTNGELDKNNTVPGDWQTGDVDVEPGLDLRWGITQDMVLNTTINPDFSQVEADAGQLDVNNTDSLYFDEKRPFFLDGASYFDTARYNFVHTRNIAEPDYGVKLTGKSDDHSYGLMVANDSHTSFIMPGYHGSDVAELSSGSDITIARYKVDVGERNNIGALMTHRSGKDYSNTLLSVDGSYWFSESDSLQYQVARSQSDNPSQVQQDFAVGDEQAGNAVSIGLARDTRDYELFASYNKLSNDFRADLGFISRVGYEKLVFGGSQTWYGSSQDLLTEWGYYGDWDKTYDEDGNMLEQEIQFELDLQGQKQFEAEFGVEHRERLYDDQYFKETQLSLFTSVTPLAGLTLEFYSRFGKQIDYSNSRLGDVVIIEPEFSWDVNEHLHIEFSHDYKQLDVDGGRLFTANQSDLRMAYQFDMHSLLKLVVQYTDIERDPDLYNGAEEDKPDSINRYFSTQLVYSYKINPQTLFFLGYSDGGYQDDNLEKLVRNQRTIFTKFSYAWQL